MSSKTDSFYAAPTHTDHMLAQLGIDPLKTSNAFSANNEIEIKQFHTRINNRANLYEEDQIQKNNQQPKQKYEDDEIPKFLNPVSMRSLPIPQSGTTIQEKQQQKAKGRKKDTKKKPTKNKSTAQVKKKEIQINMDVDQVAEWGEKGTKANNNEEDSFQDSSENQKDQFDEDGVKIQQDVIRRKIQEKIKKFETTGSYNNSNANKNTLTSLKTKAEQLKKKNQVIGQKKIPEGKQISKPEIERVVQPVQKQNKQNKSSHDQSTQQILPKQTLPVKNQKNKSQQLVIQKVESEMQSEGQDPWEQINQKTLANKQKQRQTIKNAEQMDLNQYFQLLNLPDDESEDEQPQSGYFQKLCACFKPKKIKLNHIEKQLLKISKIQLSNSAQQIRLLKQIWVSLMNKKYLRFGEHWSEVGFQGRDPATDLRSTGILSLLQWNNFIHAYASYDQQMLNFCTQFDIPLALTHIKVTSLVCHSIKNHLLEGKKWEDFQQWYNALTYYTFQYIMKNGKDRDQIGQLIEQAILNTKNNLQKAKATYNTTLKLKR